MNITIPMKTHDGGSIMLCGALQQHRKGDCKTQRDSRRKLAPECTQPDTGAIVHLSTMTLNIQSRQCWTGPHFNPIEHLQRDLEMAVHKHFPANLMELDKTCQEQWDKLPKCRCEKLIETYRARLNLPPKGLLQSTELRSWILL